MQKVLGKKLDLDRAFLVKADLTFIRYVEPKRKERRRG